jgi:prepilin-type N-terminal cleavage/methylation domain-containing protein
MMLLRNEKGFTLVEIAIVLIVVTLLLGGVMVGGSAVMENARTASLDRSDQGSGCGFPRFQKPLWLLSGRPAQCWNPHHNRWRISAGCSYDAVSATVGNGIVDTAPRRARCAIEHLVKSRMLSKVELSRQQLPNFASIWRW